MSDADIVAFIEARLTEDEQVARACVDANSWSRQPNSGRWRSPASGCDWGIVDDETGGVIVFDEGAPSTDQAEHIARHDPARVLREVEAKRAILKLHKESASAQYPDYAGGYASAFEDVLAIIATSYANHSDYREEWRP